VIVFPMPVCTLAMLTPKIGVQGSRPSILKEVSTVLRGKADEVALILNVYSLDMAVGVKVSVLVEEL
jgi:hypothetical protein